MGNVIYVAFHYREKGDALDADGNKHQAAWHEFNSARDAQKWIVERSCKTSTSPKGEIVFVIGADWTVEQISESLPGLLEAADIGDENMVCGNLVKGITAYLKYKKLCASH